MTRSMIGLAIAVAAISMCLFPRSASAQSLARVTAAGTGAFPIGAAFSGVSLLSLRFGIGVSIAADGAATGDFEGTLLGTQAGQPRTITVEGRAVNGTVPSPGSAAFSGLCTIDMGDGTPPLTGVPFAVTAVGGSGGAGTLALTLGATTLPAATTSTGSLTVR